MNGLHYPDNLYADHEERKARRVANQAPTGAYRAAPEMPESERKLRTALAYVCHARDLLNEALKLEAPAPKSADTESTDERFPAKWSVEWRDQQVGRISTMPGSHPMSAETLRAADEFGRDDNASGV